MPHFYFHLHNAVDVHDDRGLELPSLDAARSEATKAARAVMAEDVQHAGQITLSHWIAIHDAADEEVLILPFRACVEIRQ